MNNKKRILGITVAAILVLIVLAVIFWDKDDTETNQSGVVTPTASVMIDPTSVPTEAPTSTPTVEPTKEPTKAPTATPTETPKVTEEPTPTEEPVATPTPEPTATPTPEPTVAPTATSTPMPTATSTPVPTKAPTATEALKPTATPTPKPTATPTPKPTEVPVETIKETLNKANVGEYVTFGRYEQDNDMANGAEEIEWLVLDKKDGKMLLLSKYGLDCKPYHEKNESVTWETCTLRKWLNNEFYNAAFNGTEQSCILETHVVTEDSKWGRNPVNDTDDNIFVLSLKEITTYFDSDAYAFDPTRRTQPTAYAKVNGADAYPEENEYYGNAWWWLRTPGYSIGTTAFINFNGGFNENGMPANVGNMLLFP